MSKTSTTYYLWKWADNNLPGQPDTVFSELLRGRMHPAVQPFDASPMLQDLQTTAATHHSLGEEWEWQVQPADSLRHAHFIFLRCPEIPRYGQLRREFLTLAWPWDLSGYAEQQGKLIDCLLPKLNDIKFGGSIEEREFDIIEQDLPVLLSRLDPRQASPFIILKNRNNNFVQCYAHRDGFDVEWHVTRQLAVSDDYDSWRAGYCVNQATVGPRRFRDENRKLNSEPCIIRIRRFQHERLRYCDTLRIFRAFLRGKARPDQYHWRSIRPELERAKQKLRAKG